MRKVDGRQSFDRHCINTTTRSCLRRHTHLRDPKTSYKLFLVSSVFGTSGIANDI